MFPHFYDSVSLYFLASCIVIVECIGLFVVLLFCFCFFKCEALSLPICSYEERYTNKYWLISVQPLILFCWNYLNTLFTFYDVLVLHHRGSSQTVESGHARTWWPCLCSACLSFLPLILRWIYARLAGRLISTLFLIVRHWIGWQLCCVGSAFFLSFWNSKQISVILWGSVI